MLALLALGAAGSARAADQVIYAPPAAWVKPLPIPETPPATDGSPIQVLLQDTQTRMGAEGEEYYIEAVVRILKPEGLAAMANIKQEWSPDTQALTLHRVDIIRNGKAIDQLGGGKKVTVLRREANLELAVLDGGLTATIQPEGLQVGDLVVVAYTIKHHDPVFQGRSEAGAGFFYPATVGRVHIRQMWPDATPIRWRATEGLPATTVSHADGFTELTIDASNIAAPKAPRDAPMRFQSINNLQFSQFQSWAEVSALSAPLYADAATLAPDSPIRAEAEKIRKATSDPKRRAEAALRLVEDQVHYVLLAMNYNFTPAKADLTWSRRFGDCKGKTALLLALLHELGIEARPALVNTVLGDGLDERLPMLAAFDHVMVRATIGGKVYWLDGTRLGDRDLDDIPTPDVHWALPVQPAGARLEKVEPPPFEKPMFERVERLDASAGYDAPAPAHVEEVFRGDDAVTWHVSLDSLGAAQAERSLREYWRDQLSWVEPKTVSYAYDDARHEMRLSLDGAAKLDWRADGSFRDFEIDDSNLGFNTAFKREPGPHADAPFAVPYPIHKRWTVTVALPNKGFGFSLLNAQDIGETIAARQFTRRSRIADGGVTMVAEEKSLAPEFPISEGAAAADALRQLTSQDVFIRGPGPGSMGQTEEAARQPEPSTASEFSLRGAREMRQGQFDKAVASFDQAVRLEPSQGKHYYNRGLAHLRAGQDGLALADLDKAVSINPKDPLALSARGEAQLMKGRYALAKKDFERVAQLAPADSQLISHQASVFEGAGLYEDAVRSFDALAALSAAASGSDRFWGWTGRTSRPIRSAVRGARPARRCRVGA